MKQFLLIPSNNVWSLFDFFVANEFIVFYVNHVCFILAEYLEHLKIIIFVPFQTIVQFTIYFPSVIGSGIVPSNVF